MLEYPRNETNIEFTWLSSLYNPFKGYLHYKTIFCNKIAFDV